MPSRLNRVVSSFILNEEVHGHNDVGSSQHAHWSDEKLKAYLAYCKTFHPDMTPESQKILTNYYQRQRRSDLGNSARTTIRLLESLIRLSQAHARLMCRTYVSVRDAVMAVCLMESSMMTTALLGTKSTLHTTFPQDPDCDFVDVGKRFFASPTC